MYVHDKSSFRDDGTKTRWIVNINVINEYHEILHHTHTG